MPVTKCSLRGRKSGREGSAGAEGGWGEAEPRTSLPALPALPGVGRQLLLCPACGCHRWCDSSVAVLPVCCVTGGHQGQPSSWKHLPACAKDSGGLGTSKVLAERMESELEGNLKQRLKQDRVWSAMVTRGAGVSRSPVFFLLSTGTFCSPQQAFESC